MINKNHIQKFNEQKENCIYYILNNSEYKYYKDLS